MKRKEEKQISPEGAYPCSHGDATMFGGRLTSQQLVLMLRAYIANGMKTYAPNRQTSAVIQQRREGHTVFRTVILQFKWKLRHSSSGDNSFLVQKYKLVNQS